ncbi:MAG: TonB-dependent receptor, partial [Deltaproteobacteria bacterium]|nr:TonB-dependent receptor [Deltaproteobacteria bacterium]
IRDPYGAGEPTFNDLYINDGKVRRKGFELEAETLKVYNFSLKGGFSYADIELPTTSGSPDVYSVFIGVKYDDNVLGAQLFGYYNSYDLDDATYSRSSDFIWDLNISREIFNDQQSVMKLFVAAHNLFNGSQYFSIQNRNPGRWLEAGIKIRF